MGRRNKYELNIKPHLHKIPKWYETMSEGEIAKKLGVSVASFENYKKQYPELLEALHSSKQELVERLRYSLKQKAVGFSYKEIKKTMRKVDGKNTVVVEEFERYSPPDTGAIHLLLKNLDKTWHNDDQSTIDFRDAKLTLEKMRADMENW